MIVLGDHFRHHLGVNFFFFFHARYISGDGIGKIWHLKLLVSAIFYQIFIFSLNDNPLKIMENVFLFYHNSCFCSRDIQTFVIFSLPFHTFQIQKDKFRYSNLRCHEWTCINLQMSFLEWLKNCFILHHQTWSNNI